jgi:hypothetical protein
MAEAEQTESSQAKRTRQISKLRDFFKKGPDNNIDQYQCDICGRNVKAPKGKPKYEV